MEKEKLNQNSLYPRKKWTKEEEIFLKENYDFIGNDKFGLILLKSTNSIGKKASRIKLNKTFWTKEQEDFLINNYSKKTYKELSNDIGKTPCAIAQRLSKKFKFTKTKEEIGKIFKRTEKKYSKGQKHYKWKSKERYKKCVVCGKIMDWEKIRLPPNTWSKREFCSTSCSASSEKRSGKNSHFWKGGEVNWKRKNYLYNSVWWDKIRKEILLRDNFECNICFSKKNLIVHHKVPYRDGGENEEGNLITLCNSCHWKVHTRKGFEEEYLSAQNMAKGISS